MKINLTVNEEARSIDVDPETPLLWVLRDELRLTGTKFGCGVAQCGACTVHVNGAPRRSCVTPVSTLEGASVTTIEGVSGPEAEAVKAAWEKHDAPQCGYCQSGQVMSATALLQRTPTPSDEDIDNAMAGNICRCAAYVRIRAAIKSAGETLEG
jgi:isoquinoline 1-oxidoreductase alpha subunit